MSGASGEPITPDQLIGIGIIKITNAKIFESDIIKWYDKDATKNTWTTFKLHFSKSQEAINKSQPQYNLSNLGFHQ